jgi:4-hydroxyphenylpyruvate dioxygenase-like putative hemolysin
MRLDHVAYRVADRHKTVKFFQEAFGYKIQTEFEIEFDNGSKAKCFALEPPEKINTDKAVPWELQIALWPGQYELVEEDDPKIIGRKKRKSTTTQQTYHIAPEIFVSDGSPDSVVGKWVAKRDGVGGIHHVAYQVKSVEETMKEWREKGYAEFTTDEPMKCPGLTQCFTKPSALTGVIYEFIERGTQGFCKENVKDLMESTEGI